MNLRPPGDDAFDAILELFNAIRQRFYGEDESGVELRQWLESPEVDPQAQIRLAYDDGRLIGYVDYDDAGKEHRSYWVDLRVHPDHERPELVRELVAWAETASRETAQQGAVIRSWAPSVDLFLQREFKALGFGLERHSYRMQIEFDGRPDPPPLPEGVDLRPFEPSHARAVHAAHQEAFADSWQHTDESFEEWSHWLLDSPVFDPSLWFVAWDRDEVAGLALCRLRELEPDLGWIGILAVRRPWRRRGLGRALLEHAFAAFHRRGLRGAGLGVDASSLTGANRLYETAGMRVVRQLDFYAKPLA